MEYLKIRNKPHLKEYCDDREIALGPQIYDGPW